MHKSFFIYLFCILCVKTSFAQKASDELMKVRQAYIDAENFCADVNVVGYKDKSSSNTVQIGNGMLRKTKSFYYSKFSGSEMISNSKYTFIVNHNEKVITVFDIPQILDLYKKQELINIDTLLSGTDSVAYKGIANGLKTFSFYSTSSDIYRTELSVDAKTNFISKVVYYYKEPDEEDSYDVDRIVIEYKNVSTKKPDDSFFSEKKFFEKINGKLSVTAAFSKYKLKVVENEKL